MTAPAPSTEEQQIIDRFGIFEAEAREAAVLEEVARAIAQELDAHGPFYFPCKCGWEASFGAGWEDRGRQHRLTCAAVAAYRAMQDGGAEEAVRRVSAVAERLDRGGYRVFAADIRAALAPQAGDGAQ